MRLTQYLRKCYSGFNHGCVESTGYQANWGTASKLKWFFSFRSCDLQRHNRKWHDSVSPMGPLLRKSKSFQDEHARILEPKALISSLKAFSHCFSHLACIYLVYLCVLTSFYPPLLFLQVYFLLRQLQGRLCLVHLDHSSPTRRSAAALPRSSSSTCSNRTHLPQTQPPAARCLNRPPPPQPFLPFFVERRADMLRKAKKSASFST